MDFVIDKHYAENPEAQEAFDSFIRERFENKIKISKWYRLLNICNGFVDLYRLREYQQNYFSDFSITVTDIVDHIHVEIFLQLVPESRDLFKKKLEFYSKCSKMKLYHINNLTLKAEPFKEAGIAFDGGDFTYVDLIRAQVTFESKISQEWTTENGQPALRMIFMIVKSAA